MTTMMSPQGPQVSPPLPSPSLPSHDSSNDVAIDTLIEHLVNAKKALNSIDTLWRANEIVSTARSALEESVVLSARTSFLRRGITQQVRLVKRVKDGLDAIYRDGEDDFNNVLQSLDEAAQRLQETMTTLRSTIVASAFRPPSEAPRNLLEFIDESAVTVLHDTLKSSIDASGASRATFYSTLQDLLSDCRVLEKAMKNAPAKKRTESPIPALLGELQSHAAEMAHLLVSLTDHYDACVSAVRHTDGGSLALRHAVSENRIPDGVSVSGVLPSPSNSTALSPLSEHDRADMLNVISNDAAELPGVIADLSTRLGEMETLLPMILNHVSDLRSAYLGSTSAFKALSSLSTRLPRYLAASSVFQNEWREQKEALLAQGEELVKIREFYTDYLAGYHALVLEAARRRDEEEKMKAEMRKAMDKVERIREADRRERERFRREVGDFLPSDLWDGLRRDAPIWECVIYAQGEEGEGEEGGEMEEGLSTPELPKELVEHARRAREDEAR